jgi:hypothetical protein
LTRPLLLSGQCPGGGRAVLELLSWVEKPDLGKHRSTGRPCLLGGGFVGGQVTSTAWNARFRASSFPPNALILGKKPLREISLWAILNKCAFHRHRQTNMARAANDPRMFRHRAPASYDFSNRIVYWSCSGKPKLELAVQVPLNKVSPLKHRGHIKHVAILVSCAGGPPTYAKQILSRHKRISFMEVYEWC